MANNTGIIFNTIKPDLPEDNIMIINDIIEKCEHGYFLGYLLYKAMEKYAKKYPENEGIRSKKYMTKRLNSFIKGREEMVLNATKETFGLDDKIVKKLNRMFVKEIKN